MDNKIYTECIPQGKCKAADVGAQPQRTDADLMRLIRKWFLQ